MWIPSRTSEWWTVANYPPCELNGKSGLSMTFARVDCDSHGAATHWASPLPRGVSSPRKTVDRSKMAAGTHRPARQCASGLRGGIVEFISIRECLAIQERSLHSIIALLTGRRTGFPDLSGLSVKYLLKAIVLLIARSSRPLCPAPYRHLWYLCILSPQSVLVQANLSVDNRHLKKPSAREMQSGKSLAYITTPPLHFGQFYA